MVKFESGTVVSTPLAIEVAGRNNICLASLLTRHCNGDWGDLSAGDKLLNEQAVELNERVFSSYQENGVNLYVITDGNRQYTTVMLATEY